MRVFVAVEISEQVRAQIAERIEFLRHRFPDLRVGWEKPEKLHLTMKFLGEIAPEKLPDLIQAVERATSGFKFFSLEIKNVGAFPPRGAARVLWLGVLDASGNLKEIQRRLELECAAVGFEPEKRDFKPHLTIARLKEPQRARELVKLHLATDFPAASFDVPALTVFQSVLQPTGSRYTILFKGNLS